MAVLSVQSTVVYGRVGNRLTVPALERMGHDVWPIDTVRFSNHPEFGSFRGEKTEAAEIAELARGLADRGAYARCSAVLSGYLGTAANGAALLDAVAAVKRANAEALFCLDPVMGDERGWYVEPDLPEFFRSRALTAADIVIPNRYELGWLAGADAPTCETVTAAARALMRGGPRLVVATGFIEDDTISNVAVTHDAAWQAATPMVDAPAFGAGDLFSAVFLGRYLRHADISAALEHASGAVYGVMRATAAGGADSLALVEAQDEVTAPSMRPSARPLA